MHIGAANAGANNGYMFTVRVPTSRPDWHYTPRIRARHPQAQIPAECALTLWQR
jgi:starch phosphorylase